MKTLLAVLVCLALSADATQKCKYKKRQRVKWSKCEGNIQTLVTHLKDGDEGCSPTRSKTKPCIPGCRYNYNSPFGTCDKVTGLRTRKATLKKGGRQCNATLIQTIPCPKYVSLQELLTAIMEKCKYEVGKWSPCDKMTNQQTRTHTLVKGPARCQATKTNTRKCKKGCIYKKRKGDKWSKCEENIQALITYLKDGGEGCPAARTKTKPCSCRYNYKSPFSQCDKVTGLRTRIVLLKKGGRQCNATLIQTVQCPQSVSGPEVLTTEKEKCQYEIGKWSPCDKMTNQQTRTRTLVTGPARCQATKTNTRACKNFNPECKYAKRQGDKWSKCEGNIQALVTYLKDGDETCPTTRTRTKPCSCRYNYNSPLSQCDKVTGLKTRIITLKKGGGQCNATLIQTVACPSTKTK